MLIGGKAHGSGKAVEGQDKKTRTGPLVFLRQVRQEVSKVTWPNRKETLVTTAMVFLMVLLAAMFFFSVDLVLGNIVNGLLHFNDIVHWVMQQFA